MLPRIILIILCIQLYLLLPVSAVENEGKRVLSFSGYEWLVKSYNYPMGPGPNYFSDSSDNVWIDDKGFLHLKITNSEGLWRCAEVILVNSLGYGKYSFKIEADTDNMDPNIVLGLFTYEYAQRQMHHREIDIEISRWGDKRMHNALYTVQPASKVGNKYSFTLKPRKKNTTHSFRWRKNKVTFLTLGQEKWVYKGDDIPSAGRENPRINLWLFMGEEPYDGKEFEVIIKKFMFIP